MRQKPTSDWEDVKNSLIVGQVGIADFALDVGVTMYMNRFNEGYITTLAYEIHQLP